MKRSLLIIISILLLSFTTGDNRSEYNVPLAAYSLCASDLDLDGDMDIVCGHNYNWQTLWSGISILENNGEGYFNLIDSIYIYGGQTDVYAKKINNDNYPDIVGQYYDGNKSNIAILEYDNGSYYQSYFEMGDNISNYNTGYINSDSFNDIVFISNSDYYWGILYNDGTGNFSEPEYYDLSFHPIDISCGDLNNDGREDIVITGQDTEVYFSYPDGFQLSILSTDFISSSEIIDFNNDGFNDIITTVALYPINYTKLIFYKNAGNNTFINHEPFYFQPVCNSYIVISDFNNDSLPDILFNTMNDTDLIIFYNLGNFQLSDPQFIPLVNYGEYTRKSYCADFDGNGYNDIVTIRYLHATLPANLNIFFNDGKGNFIDDPVGIIENKEKQKDILSCYPNPFSEYVNIEFSVIEQNAVDLSVFDISGKHIRSITNKIYSPGKYKLKWNGTCKNGKEEVGTYLIRLKTGSQIQTERVILIK